MTAHLFEHVKGGNVANWKSGQKIDTVGSLLIFAYAAALLALLVMVALLWGSSLSVPQLSDDLKWFYQEFKPPYTYLSMIKWITGVSLLLSLFVGILLYINLNLIRAGILTTVIFASVTLVVACFGIFLHSAFTSNFEEWSEKRYNIELDNPQSTYQQGQEISYNNGHKATIHELKNGNWVIYDESTKKELEDNGSGVK